MVILCKLANISAFLFQLIDHFRRVRQTKMVCSLSPVAVWIACSRRSACRKFCFLGHFPHSPPGFFTVLCRPCSQFHHVSGTVFGHFRWLFSFGASQISTTLPRNRLRSASCCIRTAIRAVLATVGKGNQATTSTEGKEAGPTPSLPFITGEVLTKILQHRRHNVVT